MALSADVLRALRDAGATTDIIIAAVEAEERRTAAMQEAALASKRAANADRQRRFRERNASNALRDVTKRDERYTSPAKDAPVHGGVLAHPEITNLNTTDTDKTPPSEGQKRKATAPVRRSRIASDAQPTEVDRRSADDAGMTPATFRAEWGQFRDRHIAEAKTSADWGASWRNWVANWIKWGCKQHGVVTINGARAGPPARHERGNPAVEARQRILAAGGDLF